VRGTFMTTLILLATLMGTPASAQFFNNRAAIQGYLKQGGTALNDAGGYPMRFIVKRNATAVWCQTLGANVPVVAGIFNTILSGTSNCSSLSNELSGSVFAHAANSDTFVFDVVVDVNKDGFGGADDATFAGIDIVSTPLAIYSSYANTAATATTATTATSATTATTAGNVSGIVAIANGGTGAASAAAARTALGLGSVCTISTSGNAAEFLKGDGTWAAVSGSGTVTSVIGGTGLTGGTITSSGTLAVDVGTTANKIVQMTAAAKLPAVDGSLLTNVNAVQLQGRAVNSVAPSSGQVLAWNSGTSKWEATTVGGVSSVIAGSGLLGGTITSSGTIDVDSTTVGASSKIMSLDGSGVANMYGAGLLGSTSGTLSLQAAGVTSSYSLVFPAAQGGSGQYLSNNGSGVLSWATPGAPGDASYAAKGIVRFNTDAATSGISVASGLASVNFGTSANQIVKLDGSAKLPAVDASAVMNIAAGNISTGTLAMARGGTGGAITAANGGMIYSTASAMAILAPGTAGQVLTSGGAGAPTWSTPVLLSGTNTWSAANTFSSGITSPSVTGASTLTLASTGSNDLTLTGGSSGNVVISQGQLQMPASGTISSSSGDLNYSSSANATFQSASGSATTVGNTGTSSTAIQSGTGGLTMDVSGATGNVSINAGTTSGTITIGNGSTGATLLGNTGAGSNTTLQSLAVNVGSNSTTTVDIGGTGMTSLDLGNNSTGTLTTTVGSAASASATTIQAGSGKVKIGSAGVGFTAMGVCTIASTTLNTTAANKTCTGIPASTAVAVHCSPGAALSSGTAAFHARSTGTLDQIAMRATASLSATTYTCMFMY